MSVSRRQDDAGGKEQEETMAVEGIGRGNIVPIELLRRRHAARETGRGDGPPRPPGAGAGSGANPATGDAAEAAAARAEARPRSAEERARLVDRFKSETADLPDVRRDKVIEAKLRISTGYYNRDEVRREVLRSVLANLLPPPPAAGAPAEGWPRRPGEPAIHGGVPAGPPERQVDDGHPRRALRRYEATTSGNRGAHGPRHEARTAGSPGQSSAMRPGNPRGNAARRARPGRCRDRSPGAACGSSPCSTTARCRRPRHRGRRTTGCCSACLGARIPSGAPPLRRPGAAAPRPAGFGPSLPRHRPLAPRRGNHRGRLCGHPAAAAAPGVLPAGGAPSDRGAP